MLFWEHGEQEKQKQLSQPNKFLVFFVFKNRKHFLKTPTKQALYFYVYTIYKVFVIFLLWYSITLILRYDITHSPQHFNQRIFYLNNIIFKKHHFKK